MPRSLQLPVLLRPRALGAHLLVVAAVAATIALGLWQLAAWEAGREREQRDVSAVAAVPLLDAMGGDDPFPGQFLGRPVALSGQWLGDSTLYVADRARDGEWGYWAVTPVLVDGTDSAMPVVRGWTPRPEATGVSGPVRLEGWLQPSEGSNLPDPDRSDDVIPEMRVASVTEHVDGDLFSAFVVAGDAGDAGTGLAAVTPEQIPSISPVTSLKNLLYAIQWWLFGGFATYIWWRWCKDELELERGTGDEVLLDEPVVSRA